MEKKWSVTKLIATVSLAVVNAIFQLAASGVTVATGISMASGVITSFTVPLMLVLCLQVIDRFGAGIFFMTVTGILDLPMAIAGPPGFLPKVFLQMGMGLIADIIYYLLKNKSKLLAAAIIGGIDDIYITFTVIAVGQWLNIPGISKISTFISLPIFIIAIFIMGAIGGYLGILVYSRLKNTNVITRIQEAK